ncbi:MFS transporter, partial [Thioclava sp. BHET1]
MRSARLSLAFETGAITLPVDGPLLVLRPHADDDFNALPQDRLTLVQGFRPDHDALAARGFAVRAQAEGQFAAALVCLPRARAEAQALVAEAVSRVPVGAPVVIDGQKTEGIDTMLRDCRARVAV